MEAEPRPLLSPIGIDMKYMPKTFALMDPWLHAQHVRLYRIDQDGGSVQYITRPVHAVDQMSEIQEIEVFTAVCLPFVCTFHTIADISYRTRSPRLLKIQARASSQLLRKLSIKWQRTSNEILIRSMLPPNTKRTAKSITTKVSIASTIC